MTLQELVDGLGLTVYNEGAGLAAEIAGGYTSDLLSDVMGHAGAGYVWITLQAHKNVAAIASLKELAAVILVKGFRPDAEMLDTARQEGIPVLGSTEPEFELSGKIYALLNK
ncbi:MAG: serine kinase [Rikenellaceae bacterium]|jgi:serine kinase of HPr protein (carbohydrate metabolism regulator)|nr:serine kinase [Rikenellaceae bacterium]